MKPKSIENQIMHASDWYGQQDLSGWSITEKYDGFFARWNGHTLLSREGVDFKAPEWFTKGLPAYPLDCELWAGYGRRTTLNNCERWHDPDRWSVAKLIVFDHPTRCALTYKERREVFRRIHKVCLHAAAVESFFCFGPATLLEALATVKAGGGEGLVVRHPGALYTPGRVRTMFKVK